MTLSEAEFVKNDNQMLFSLFQHVWNVSDTLKKLLYQ